MHIKAVEICLLHLFHLIFLLSSEKCARHFIGMQSNPIQFNSIQFMWDVWLDFMFGKFVEFALNISVNLNID